MTPLTDWARTHLNPTIFWYLGHKRRLGLIGAKRTTITVHRSEEVLPSDVGRHLVRQGTSVSSEGDAENDLLVAQEGERWELPPFSNSLERRWTLIGWDRCWFDKVLKTRSGQSFVYLFPSFWLSSAGLKAWNVSKLCCKALVLCLWIHLYEQLFWCSIFRS